MGLPPDGQITQSCQSLSVKIFRFTRIPIYSINPPSCSAEGRCASSRFRWSRMRWTLRRQAGRLPAGRNAGGVRRNRVVLAPRPWRYVGGDYPAGHGGKKGRSPGRARISRQTSRGESRDVSAVPVKSVCVLVYPLHTVLRAQSAPGFPCASLPRRGATRCKNPDISRRGNASACLTCRGLSTDARIAS